MYVTHAPGLPDLLFVAERGGIIRAVDLATGATLTPAFLDITPLVVTSFARGLLGLAFRNDYGTGHRREDA